MTQVEKSKKNILKCRCKFCPTYTWGCLLKAAPQMTKIFAVPGALGKEEKVENLFCAYGKSGCIKEGKKCLCPNCPVHKAYGLEGMFYCLAE